MQTDGKVVCGDIYRTEQYIAVANKLHEKKQGPKERNEKASSFFGKL